MKKIDILKLMPNEIYLDKLYWACHVNVTRIKNKIWKL